MRTPRLGRVFGLFLVVVVAVPLFAVPDFEPLRDDPPPPYTTGGGGGGSCNYCSQYRCGCGAAPAGYRLDSWSCSCGNPTCSQSCNYVPL
jgi:hypothetical protein